MGVMAQETVISTLRLRGLCHDPLAMRLRFDAALSAVDFAPASLSPQAIVVIRSLRDPLPGRWRPKQVGERPPQAWQQAVNQKIEALAGRAARPAQGFVPDSAEAVIFMDRSELLACIARDWCLGTAPTRWWWRGLLRDKNVAEVVATEWLQSPEYVPSAMQQLAVSGEAPVFLQRLDASSIWLLLNRVVERFGLVRLQPLLVDHVWKSSDRIGALPASDDRAPWSPWAVEAAEPDLTALQAACMGTTLMVHRAPAVVRSETFTRAVTTWIHRVSKGGDADKGESAGFMAARPAVSVPIEHEVGDRGGRSSDGLGPAAGMAHGLFAVGPEKQEDSPRESLDSASVSEQGIVGEQSGVAPVAWPSDSAGADEQLVSRPLPSQRDKPLETIRTEADLGDHVTVETSFGGVFYLINLALYLELYGDFSEPLKPGIALSPWDFVALVGERLVGERIHEDPVWPLLARLAGRDEGVPPGQDFHPPVEWRLQMMERWGYAGPSAPVQFETASFIDWFMPYVRQRLMQALGLDQEHELATILCEHHATVQVTATHVDVMLSLTDLPIAVRYAGLDRNPGWIPAAGRYVAFHFASG